jgi:uncharacterized membrane-anchored protein
MIFNKEAVLTEGKEFRFKTAPIDPTDPFRGKYIILSFEENTIQVFGAEDWNQGDQVFVSITEDEQGFAKIISASKEKPSPEEDFVSASVSYVFTDSLNSQVTLEYPFNRFYMEESKAEEAEKAYWESAVDSTDVTYALVNILNGEAVITNVMINDVPISEVAKARLENQEQ